MQNTRYPLIDYCTVHLLLDSLLKGYMKSFKRNLSRGKHLMKCKFWKEMLNGNF